MAELKIDDSWKKIYTTSKAQADFFHTRFPDVPKSEIDKLREQFDKHDSKKRGELEDDEAMRLMEARGETKTVKELHHMIAEMDVDKNRKLAFLELCCALHKKSWKTLHEQLADPTLVEALNRSKLRAAQFETESAEEAKHAAEAKEKAEHEAHLAHEALSSASAQKKALEDGLAAKHAEEEAKKHAEEERKKASVAQGGAKGRAAMFDIAAQGTADTTKNNAERIKREAAEKKLKKEAEKIADEATRKHEEAEKTRKEAEEAAEKKQREAVEAERDRKELEEKEAASAAARKLRDEHLAAKAKEEEEKKAEEEKARIAKEESKARLAAKSALWK